MRIESATMHRVQLSDFSRSGNIMSECPFCSIDFAIVSMQTPHAWSIPDAYPLTEGHTLIIPRSHVASIFELPESVQTELWSFVARVRLLLIEKHRTCGFNIGINDGVAAGQTINHAHIHIIPRRTGDVPDPRGGIRWAIPSRAAYWERGL